MQLMMDAGFISRVDDHPLAAKFHVLMYESGCISLMPHHFLCNWLGEEPQYGKFTLGRGSGIGLGSTARYDGNEQELKIGRFNAIGSGVRFILNGQHPTNLMAMAHFGAFVPNMQYGKIPQYGDTIVKNDIWIGDEAMILGGSTIENGCIIGARALLTANFRTEPYGVYVGAPARLLKFRFSEKIREALLALAWWELPVSWIQSQNASFLQELDKDEGKTLEMLAELERLTR